MTKRGEAWALPAKRSGAGAVGKAIEPAAAPLSLLTDRLEVLKSFTRGRDGKSTIYSLYSYKCITNRTTNGML